MAWDESINTVDQTTLSESGNIRKHQFTDKLIRHTWNAQIYGQGQRIIGLPQWRLLKVQPVTGRGADLGKLTTEL